MTDTASPASFAFPHRRTFLGALLASAALLGAANGAAHAQPAGGEPIPIGLSAPLTTQFAQNGKWMREGAELAIKEINAAGGIKGRPLQLFVEDDQGPNPTGAANAVTKLITQDKVAAIVGPHYTPAILAVQPLLARYQVAALSGATGPVVTAQGNKFTFRVRLNDEVGAKLLVRFLTGEQGWKTIGMDYVNTAFGQGGFSAVKTELEAEHITPAIVQTHLDSTKDFTPQLLAFGNADIQGLIIWTDDQPMGLLTKQIRTLGLKFGIAGNAGLTLPNVLALSGDATDGAFAVGEFISNNPDPAKQEWNKRYRAAYGNDPELYGSVYYDATRLVADAMRRAPEVSGPAVAKALGETHDVKGVVTTYDAAANGDMVHSALITRNEHGAPAILKTVSEKQE